MSASTVDTRRKTSITSCRVAVVEPIRGKTLLPHVGRVIPGKRTDSSEAGMKLATIPYAPRERSWSILAVGNVRPEWIPYLGETRASA